MCIRDRYKTSLQTFINAMAGLEKPTKGEINIGGIPVSYTHLDVYKRQIQT